VIPSFRGGAMNDEATTVELEIFSDYV